MFDNGYGGAGMTQGNNENKNELPMIKILREGNAYQSWVRENVSPTWVDPNLTPIYPAEAEKMYDQFLKENNMTGEEHFYKLKAEREAAEAKNNPNPPSP